MIPKKIHYCWFGHNEKSPMMNKCIASWKKYMPDYEIIEWNESNFDINYNQYVKEAYEQKKYAFVSDVARLYILYHEGGIYFDVDVELIKRFNDDILKHGFMGFEDTNYVNTGLGFGVNKNNKIIKEMLDDYNDISFVKEDKTLDLVACPVRNSKILVRNGIKLDDSMQQIEDIIIYPKDYFSPKNCLTGVLNITENTYTIHHYDGSWLSKSDQKNIQKRRNIVSKYGLEEGMKKYNRKLKIIGLKRYFTLPFRFIKKPKYYLNKLFKKENTKKKILLTTFNMTMGGVEKVLVNLLNQIDYSKYDITVYLQFREGELLDQINKNVQVKDFNLSKISCSLLRKVINGIKYLKLLIINYHKYDFAGCFSPPGNLYSSKLVRISSKNNAIWLHTNILECVKNDEKVLKKYSKYSSVIDKTKAYLRDFGFRKFKKNVFVSQNAMECYLKLYPIDKSKAVLCRNLIDYETILDKSKEHVSDFKINKNLKVFINVGRHTEHDKRLTRLINACNKLKKDYNFIVLLIGDGPCHDDYIDLVKKYHLEDYIKFLGLKKNPYPYFKLADAFVLTSIFEGFPTTFSEAMTISIPIITTNVSDASSMVDKKYGIVVNNDDNSIYDGMKLFLEKGFTIKEEFNPKKYNEESLKTMGDLFNGKL